MFLNELEIGEKALVVELENAEKIKNRLKNMGLVNGVKIRVVRKAYFNGPIEIKLRDFYLALRVDDAKYIKVNKL
ncbi:MAG: ferrous iron transport protein A [Clostridia bacterium]|nr:ferrous iron transport protein A [Clostridia bacterium]